MLENQPRLSLFDTQGKDRVSLELIGEDPYLSLEDATGKGWVSLAVEDSQPSLQVGDAAGFKALIGTANLERTKTGEVHRTSAASVVLFNKEGKVIWRTP